MFSLPYEVLHIYYLIFLQGCEQVGSALNLPPTAVLCGYIILGLRAANGQLLYAKCICMFLNLAI